MALFGHAGRRSESLREHAFVPGRGDRKHRRRVRQEQQHRCRNEQRERRRRDAAPWTKEPPPERHACQVVEMRKNQAGAEWERDGPDASERDEGRQRAEPLARRVGRSGEERDGHEREPQANLQVCPEGASRQCCLETTYRHEGSRHGEDSATESRPRGKRRRARTRYR